jgi:hypothetical protein
MSSVDDLVSFLRARLDEDEQVAREITAPEWSEGCSWLADLRDPLPSQRRAYGLPKEWQLLSEADTRHIARWDPARVLAEVEAKRGILDEYRLWADDDSRDYDQSRTAVDRSAALEEVVKLLAQPYADHADFRSEWRREV